MVPRTSCVTVPGSMTTMMPTSRNLRSISAISHQKVVTLNSLNRNWIERVSGVLPPETIALLAFMRSSDVNVVLVTEVITVRLLIVENLVLAPDMVHVISHQKAANATLAGAVMIAASPVVVSTGTVRAMEFV